MRESGRLDTRDSSTRSGSNAPTTNGDPIHALIVSLERLREEVRELYEIRLDQFRVGLRDLLRGAVAKLAAWVAGYILGIVAVCFLMHGAALGLAAICGNRPWAGFMLAGLLLLAAVASAVQVLDAQRRRQNLQQMEEKHASGSQVR